MAALWSGGAPDHRPAKGKPEVGRFFKQVGELWNFERFDPKQFVTQGDEVVVLGAYGGTAKPTGRKFAAEWSTSSVASGKIVKFREYTDTANLIQALSTATARVYPRSEGAATRRATGRDLRIAPRLQLSTSSSRPSRSSPCSIAAIETPPTESRNQPSSRSSPNAWKGTTATPASWSSSWRMSSLVRISLPVDAAAEEVEARRQVERALGRHRVDRQRRARASR